RSSSINGQSIRRSSGRTRRSRRFTARSAGETHVARHRPGMTRIRAALAAALAVALALHPLATEAQPTGKAWRIGFISVAYMRIENVFFQHLKELGYVEGQNLVVERRYSDGRAERFPEFATALARLNPDLIIATTTPAALAVKNATKTI